MKLTTNQIAERVNLTRARITQLIRDEIIVGEKIGRDWMIDDDQIPIIHSLPDNRGKFRWKNKSTIKSSANNLQTV